MDNNQKSKKVGFAIYGDIHVAGPMFDIHDNDNVYIDGMLQKKKDQQASKDDSWEMKELKFFGMQDFDTAEKQLELSKALRSSALKIDRDNGREWFGHYAAYRYAKKQSGSSGRYVDFFSDIEALIPDMLHVELSEAKGDVRYKNYTKALGREVNDWYVDNRHLPPINCLVYRSYHFGCNESRFIKMKSIISELYRWFNDNT